MLKVCRGPTDALRVGDLADWLSAIDDALEAPSVPIPVEDDAPEHDEHLDDDLARALADAIEHGPMGAPTPAPVQAEALAPWMHAAEADDGVPIPHLTDQGFDGDPPDLDDLFGDFTPEPRTVEVVAKRDELPDGDELFAPDALPSIDKFLAVIESRDTAATAKAAEAAAEVDLFDDDRSWTNDLKSWSPADDDILPVASKAKTRSKHSKKPD